MKRIAFTVVAVGTLAAGPAAAQDRSLSAACAELPGQAQGVCLTVAQAGQAAQPQLGILIEGGNPVLGTASTSGVRLGVLPRVSASLRANGVLARVPNVLGGAGDLDEEETLPLAALGGNVSVGVFPGLNLAPTVGGFGSVDLLGSATWLPFNAVDAEGFGEESDDFAWGVGARVGLLRESFTLPGISVSVMRHTLGTVRYGRACEGSQTVIAANRFACAAGGDVGEVAFDLTGWSGRAAVSKRLVGLGLTAGVGYDRFTSDVDFAVRADGTATCGGAACASVYRFADREIRNDRWSGFVDASYTFLVGTLTAEAGWMQGADPLPGFDTANEFDPESGTFFGSLGVRLSL